jgi:hypothetical protein
MKRLSSSCSAAAPKRQNDDIEELKCSICFDLAVDAVQVSCCGALHCSDCISKCAACPMCRNAVVRWVSDFRRERLSAAALRQCPNQGCAFEGNRASLMAHQEECDFLPRVFLKHKLKCLLDAASVHSASIVSLQAQQLALMACALGAQPAVSALRLLYNLCPSRFIFEVDRSAAHAQEHCVCVWRDSAFVQSQPKMTYQQFVEQEDAKLVCRTLLVYLAS